MQKCTMTYSHLWAALTKAHHNKDKGCFVAIIHKSVAAACLEPPSCARQRAQQSTRGCGCVVAARTAAEPWCASHLLEPHNVG